MKFPNAAKGVRKIFSAEILSLIAALATGVAGILAVVSYSSYLDDNDVVFAATSIPMIILGIAAGVLIVVSAIMGIIGYSQASKDDDYFKKALYCIIIGFILSFAANILVNQTGFLGWLCTVFNVLSEVSHLAVVIFSVMGIMNMSANCHEPDMVRKGALIIRLISMVYTLYIIDLFVIRVFRDNDFNRVLVIALSIASMVLSVAQYILYLNYLHSAKKMLNKN